MAAWPLSGLLQQLPGLHGRTGRTRSTDEVQLLNPARRFTAQQPKPSCAVAQPPDALVPYHPAATPPRLIKDRSQNRSSTAFETVLPPCSDAGGIEIEENWDLVKSITIPTLGEASGDALAPLLGGLPLELRPGIENFIRSAYAVSVAALTIWLLKFEFFNQPRAR